MNNPFETIDARLCIIENLLLDLKHSTKETGNIPEIDRWFNLDELCEYLPDKPVKATVYGYVHSLSIPFHKTTKRLRFLKSEIDLWLKEGRKKTVKEIASEVDSYLKKRKN
jgi:hypothetical protein